MVRKLIIIVAVALMAQMAHSALFGESEFRGGLMDSLLLVEGKKSDPAFKSCFNEHTTKFYQEAQKVEETIKKVSKKLSAADAKFTEPMEKLLASFTRITTFVWPKIIIGEFKHALSKYEECEISFRKYFDDVSTALAKNPGLKRHTLPLQQCLSNWEIYCEDIGKKVNKCITESSGRQS